MKLSIIFSFFGRTALSVLNKPYTFSDNSTGMNRVTFYIRQVFKYGWGFILKRTYISIILLSGIFCLFALDPANTGDGDSHNIMTEALPEQKQSTDKTTSDMDTISQNKKEKSDYEKNTDILKYGLNSDIIKLIQNLSKENDTRFNDELQKIFLREKNIALKTEILKFFTSQKDAALKTAVFETLQNFYDYNTEYSKACIDYITKLEIQERAIVETLHGIIDGEKSELKEVAILALGKLGSNDDAVYLTEVYETEAGDDTQALVNRQAILQALIDLHASETFDFLQDLATDNYENAIIRARAITALGKIAHPDSVKILLDAFQESDPIIRTAAVAGLSGFTGNAEVDDLLLQAFKDEYYKVRLQAIDTADETKNQSAIPFILYRAKSDPETLVKNRAIEALAKTDNAEALEWLRESFTDEKTSAALRIKIATELLKNNDGLILDEVESAVLHALSDKPKQQFAYNLGKSISGIQSEALAKICAAFLLHKESRFKSIGLDMFQSNRFPSIVPEVEQIAKDKKSGTLQKRAQTLLEQSGAVPPAQTESSGAVDTAAQTLPLSDLPSERSENTPKQ